MGVPLFFKFLTQKYPDIIKKYDKNLLKINELFFDFNGLIHPACSKARSEYLDNANTNYSEDILYSKMLKKIKDQTDNIINITDPSDYILLAVDGVAPLAKINQQRSRRYKSRLYQSKVNKIKEKYNIVQDTWDTNAISPGTPFMNKLMTDLEKFVEICNSKNTCKTDLNTSNNPGEGEHKILKYIKENNTDNTRNKVIYGLDADLIMLAIASNVSNIYLLRESVHFGKVDDDEYLLLDIDCLKRHLCNEIKSFISDVCVSDKQILTDYLFICFVIGNDFIPHLPPLHIGEGSIDFLLESYGTIISNSSKGLVSDSYTVNLDLFALFLKQIYMEEDIMVKSFYKSYIRKRYGDKYTQEAYKKEIRRYDFLPMTVKVKDTICFNKNEWQYRYYSRYLNTDNYTNQDINNICKNYYEGLEWNLKYYFTSCPCWHWFYKFTCSPTTSDLHKYILGLNENYLFKETRPISTVQQLLCILPPSSYKLLPVKYQFLMKSELSPIRDLYPSFFKLEMLYKKYFHECIPKLPNIDLERIFSEINKIS